MDKTKIWAVVFFAVITITGIALAQNDSSDTPPRPPTQEEIDSLVELMLEKGPEWKDEIRSLFLEKLKISLPYTIVAGKSYNSTLGYRYAGFVTALDNLQAGARNPTSTDFVYFRWQHAKAVEVSHNAILEDLQALPKSAQEKRAIIESIQADFEIKKRDPSNSKKLMITVSNILPIVCDGRTFQVESEKNHWIASMTFEPQIKQKILQNQTQGLANEFVELHKNTGKKNIGVIYSYVTRVQNTEDEITELGPFTIALKPNQIFGLIAVGKENFQKVYEDIGQENMTSPLAGEDGFQFSCKISKGKSLFGKKVKKPKTRLKKATEPEQKPKQEEETPQDHASTALIQKLLGIWRQETGISMGGPRNYEFLKDTMCDRSTDVVSGNIDPCDPSQYMPYSIQNNTLTIHRGTDSNTYQLNWKGAKLEITYPDGETKWLFRKIK